MTSRPEGFTKAFWISGSRLLLRQAFHIKQGLRSRVIEVFRKAQAEDDERSSVDDETESDEGGDEMSSDDDSCEITHEQPATRTS